LNAQTKEIGRSCGSFHVSRKDKKKGPEAALIFIFRNIFYLIFFKVHFFILI